MSQEQPQRPITYGDVFPVVGDVSNQPITAEDASLMQSAETLALAQTQKGGAASIMQSAADRNIKAGFVPPDAHSTVAEQGVTVAQTILPAGEILQTEVVAGQPVRAEVNLVPSIPNAAKTEGVTIGEALEVAALAGGDVPVELSDATAIQSAEKRATGYPITEKDSISAMAMSAAELNPRVDDYAKTTLSDVLTDASVALASDKLVTREDAEKVAEAEARHRPEGTPRATGVAAALHQAAEFNEAVREPAALGGTDGCGQNVRTIPVTSGDMTEQMDSLQIEQPPDVGQQDGGEAAAPMTVDNAGPPAQPPVAC